MTRNAIGCLAVLLGAGCLFGFAGKAEGAKPEKLMRVTLESEDELGVTVIPLCCMGADVVNAGGHGKGTKKIPKRMTFDCLPGATVQFVQREDDGQPGGILTLLPGDDGKTVHLRFGDRACYKNGLLCMLDFSKSKNAKDIGKRLDVLKQARKDKNLDSLTIIIVLDASVLPVLRELKGSGAGVAVATIPDKKDLPDLVLRELCRAIEEVKPRLLEVDKRGLDLMKDRLSTVESLILGFDSPSEIPDLSRLTSLRHLILSAPKDGRAVDLKPLGELTQLKALTVFALEQECKNAKAIGSLAHLQFLVIDSRPPVDPSSFQRFPNLRYLAATFPADADFSFVEKMRDLQTLCILNVAEKHNLKPLERLPLLRCLALSQVPEGDDSFTARGLKNVQAFEKARPDVEVVEYRGICLGSFWLLPLAAATAVAAWLIRRRWGGKRLVWQR